MTARDVALQIVKREGDVFTNDPDDRGGPTRYGVSLATAKRHGLDVDGDGDVDIDDIRNLPRDRAVQVFLDAFYYEPRISLLLPKLRTSGVTLRASVFDCAVHSGQRSAIKMLQRLFVRCGCELTIDGKIGNQTLAAAEELASRDVKLLRSAFAIERRNKYLRIALNNRTQVKYCVRRNGGKGGWIKRAEIFMGKDYRYTNAEWRDVVKELRG